MEKFLSPETIYSGLKNKEINRNIERAKNSGKPAVIDVKTSWTIPDATKLMGSMGIL